MYRFLEIALGSPFELETQLMLTKDLYPSVGVTNQHKSEILEIQKMINAFKSKLIASS